MYDSEAISPRQRLTKRNEGMAYARTVSYRPKSNGHHAGETIAFSQEYLIMDLVPMSRFSSGHVVFIKSILMINEG